MRKFQYEHRLNSSTLQRSHHSALSILKISRYYNSVSISVVIQKVSTREYWIPISIHTIIIEHNLSE